jgi:hypothetical protein
MRHLALAALLLTLGGCSSPSVDVGTETGLTDQLTFGTGLDYVNSALTGEATTFDIGAGTTLFFRLDSSLTFAGRFVRLYFNGADPQDFVNCRSATGSICMTGFWAASPGTFGVKAYLVDAGVSPEKEYFVAGQTIILR